MVFWHIRAIWGLNRPNMPKKYRGCFEVIEIWPQNIGQKQENRSTALTKAPRASKIRFLKTSFFRSGSTEFSFLGHFEPKIAHISITSKQPLPYFGIFGRFRPQIARIHQKSIALGKKVIEIWANLGYEKKRNRYSHSQ